MKKIFFFMAVVLFGVVRLNGHEPSPGVQVEVLTQTTDAWDGSSLPDEFNKVTEVTVLRITMAPKAKLPMHKHPMINAGYLVSGELTVHSESGKTHKIRQGDALVEMVDRWHFGVNDGKTPAMIIVVYVGNKGEKLSVLKAQETTGERISR